MIQIKSLENRFVKLFKILYKVQRYVIILEILFFIFCYYDLLKKHNTHKFVIIIFYRFYQILLFQNIMIIVYRITWLYLMYPSIINGKSVNHINIIIFNKDGRQVLLNNTPLIKSEYEHISNVEGYRQVSDDPNYPFFCYDSNSSIDPSQVNY
ncbi:hypothetical protein Hanom_Chr07g00587891 [Helianthus anomalus]